MTILKYSFPLTPPPAAPQPPHQYAYSEFTLELAARWRQIPTDEDDTLTFHSDDDGAAVIISADFFDITNDKAEGVAEQCIGSRLGAIQAGSDKPLKVLQQSIKPHSGGVGLELSFAAEVEGGHVHLYLGYVTARKILNFSMVCQPDRYAAADLFNATVRGFRPRLP
jgi:hypothetical protein